MIDLRARVEEAERRVEDYRKAKALQSSDGHLPPEQQLKDANTALIETRGKRAELESKYQQLVAALRGGGSIESLNETIHAPLIEKLRGDYAALARDEAFIEATLGPRHPSYQTTKAQGAALRKQINAEMQRISLAQKRELTAARNAEKAAEQLVADLQSSIGRLGGPKLELNELERQAAALRERYEKALAASENVRRDVVSSPNGVLIDQPYAEKARTSPKTLPVLLIGLAAGLNLWIVSALITEFVRRKRKQNAPLPVLSTESEPPLSPTKTRLRKAPFIADVPDIVDALHRKVPHDLGARISQAMQRPNTAYRNAIEEIYDALQSALAEDGATPVVAIASSQDGANVATIALALAHAGLMQGDKILLIDADPAQNDLAALISKLPRALMPDAQARLYAYVQSDEDIGEILLSTLDGRRENWPLRGRIAELFDLVIVACGVLPIEGALLAPAKEIAAVVLVESEAEDWTFVDDILDECDLTDRCVGIICSPEHAQWSRTA